MNTGAVKSSALLTAPKKMSVGIPAFFDAPPVVFACCIIKRPMTFEAVISVGYDSLEQPPREIHADKRSLNMRGTRYNAATFPSR